MNTYLLKEWPPIAVLIGGLILVSCFLYLHSFQKTVVVRWIAKYIFRNQLMANRSADNLVNVITSFIVTIGGLWIILAIYYLTY